MMALKPDDFPEGSLQILITGRCGSGKSTLINALLGDHTVPERIGVRSVSRSKDILAFNNKNFMPVPVQVWVSTHLQHHDFKNEEKYLEDLKRKCGNVDLIIYCLKMTETVFLRGNPDAVAMGKMYKTLGVESLKKTIFALTFANICASTLDKAEYKEIAAEQWLQIIKDTLNEFPDCSQVEVVPVGHHKEMELPTCDNWLESVWCKSLDLMSEEAQQKMAANNRRRFFVQKEGEKIIATNPGSTPLVFSSKEKFDKYCELADKIGKKKDIPGTLHFQSTASAASSLPVFSPRSEVDAMSASTDWEVSTSGISHLSPATSPSNAGEAEQAGWSIKRSEIILTGPALGKGGWGEVQVATFRETKVAAKILRKDIPPSYHHLFAREMEMAARIRHPNLVLFIGASVGDEKVILTELMSESLHHHLGTLYPNIPSETFRVSVSLDVARALNYLHLMQPDPIIHRDISSANVLLDCSSAGTYKAKVSDYGTLNIKKNITTENPGCLPYSAPEAQQPSEQSVKMDTFSFGVLVLEQCTARLPFIDERASVIQTIMETKWVEFINECIRSNPAQRPDMSQIISRLTGWKN